MHGYVPGLQPDGGEIIKLNTNENPFPVSEKVRAALSREIESNRLHLYPNPTSAPLRARLAEVHGRENGCVLVGNGSDEVLSILFRGVLEPEDSIVFANPSYSLYPVLADILGVTQIAPELRADWRMDFPALLAASRGSGNKTRNGKAIPDAPLTVITNPNAPTGIAAKRNELLMFARENQGLTLVDEAYVEFGGESVADAAGTSEFPRLLVCNTMSKVYSLAGMRVGWLLGHPEIIAELDKVRDSYNLSRLAQTAALAVLDDLDVVRERVEAVKRDRDAMIRDLGELGFSTLPSSANFIFTKPPETSGGAGAYFKFLNERRIIVRYFDKPRLNEFVRISVGNPEQIAKLLEATREFLNG